MMTRGSSGNGGVNEIGHSFQSPGWQAELKYAVSVLPNRIIVFWNGVSTFAPKGPMIASES
jgi:hypothetical protein